MELKRRWLIIILTVWSIIPGKVYGQQPPLFVEGGTGGQLISVTLADCHLRFIDTISPFGLQDLAFTNDGRLWGVTPDSITGGLLFRIDTATAQGIYIGHTDDIYGNSLVALNDSILLMESQEDLYAINNRGASVHYIGHIGFPSYGDLTWYNNDLYMTTPFYAWGGFIDFNVLIRITFNEAYDSIRNVYAVNNEWGKLLPGCMALTTASVPGTDSSYIVGFTGRDIIKINPEDGSFSTLCPDAFPLGGIGGAAYVGAYPKAIPHPPSTDSFYMSVYPNPAHKKTTVELHHFKGNWEDLRLDLFDFSGRLLLRRGIQNPIEILDLNPWSAGFYFVRVFYENKEIGKSILVIK